MSDIVHRLYEIIRNTTVMVVPITPSSEVYYDLRISGDDLDEMLDIVVKEFGTDLAALRVVEYAPNEGCEISRPILHALGKRPYKSLTVQALLDAIEKGRWG